MALFCVISANSGSFRAHCVKVHVRCLISWWVPSERALRDLPLPGRLLSVPVYFLNSLLTPRFVQLFSVIRLSTSLLCTPTNTNFLANAICCRPSVCLSVCRLSSVVCNARAPYSGGWNFPQYFYGSWYLGHPDIHIKLYGNRPRGTPPPGELNSSGVVKYGDFRSSIGYIWETVQNRRKVSINQ